MTPNTEGTFRHVGDPTLTLYLLRCIEATWRGDTKELRRVYAEVAEAGQLMPFLLEHTAFTADLLRGVPDAEDTLQRWMAACAIDSLELPPMDDLLGATPPEPVSAASAAAVVEAEETPGGELDVGGVAG